MGRSDNNQSFDGYRTIVADPPWKQKGGPLVGGVAEGFIFNGTQTSRDLPYPTMTLDAIKALIALRGCGFG